LGAINKLEFKLVHLFDEGFISQTPLDVKTHGRHLIITHILAYLRPGTGT